MAKVIAEYEQNPLKIPLLSFANAGNEGSNSVSDDDGKQLGAQGLKYLVDGINLERNM